MKKVGVSRILSNMRCLVIIRRKTTTPAFAERLHQRKEKVKCYHSVPT